MLPHANRLAPNWFGKVNTERKKSPKEWIRAMYAHCDWHTHTHTHFPRRFWLLQGLPGSLLFLSLFSLWWWWCWSAFVCSVALLAQATKRRYPNNIVFSIIMWYFRMHLMKPRVWLIRHMRNHSLNAFFVCVFFSFVCATFYLIFSSVRRIHLFVFANKYFHVRFFSTIRFERFMCVNEFSVMRLDLYWLEWKQIVKNTNREIPEIIIGSQLLQFIISEGFPEYVFHSEVIIMCWNVPSNGKHTTLTGLNICLSFTRFKRWRSNGDARKEFH